MTPCWQARLWGVLLAGVLLSGCSSSDSTTGARAEAAGAPCQASADEIIDRFEEFLARHTALTPAEFLADPALDGLDEFQQDIGEIIVRVTTDPDDECTQRGLETRVGVALNDVSGGGLVGQSLVETVQRGLVAEPRDVVLTPDDDLGEILPLLGPGSSATFGEGTFRLDATLLVQTDLVLTGVGRGRTTLVSTAEVAAIAVLGGGALAMTDLSVEHEGASPASVLIVADAPLTLSGVGISGAVADEDGGGGSGIVLSSSAAEERDPVATSPPTVAIADSVVNDNAAAGIAVTATFAPTIVDSQVSGNGQCGICYFDDATGDVQTNRFEGNAIGVQVSGSARPRITEATFVDNTVAAMLVEVTAAPTIVGNEFTGAEVVGIDVQGAAAPSIQRNTFGPHAVAISLRGESAATVVGNELGGSEVAVLVGGTAQPTFTENVVRNSTVAAIVHGDSSAAIGSHNVISPADGAGIVIEGVATPNHRFETVEGGLVGAVFRESGGGSIADSMFAGQQVGIEVGDSARGEIVGTTFDGQTQAGVIFSGEAEGALRTSVFTGMVSIGVQLGGQGAPLIEDNTIDGGDTALLINQNSRAEVVRNQLRDQNFGVGVSGSAHPIIEDNLVSNSAAGALSFEGDSAGFVRSNMIVDAGVVGIRIAEDSAPIIEDNSLFALIPQLESTAGDSSANSGAAVDGGEDGGESGAGMLYADRGAGRSARNEVFGFVIGIQVSDAASPELTDNRLEGAGAEGVGILYGLNASGRATGNVSLNQQLGFQFSGDAAPEVVGNTVESAGAVAFLVQGDARPTLTTNSCDASAAGIVLLDNAAPALADNRCLVAEQ